MNAVNIMDDTNDKDVLFIFTDGSYNDCYHVGSAMAILYLGNDILHDISVDENCLRLNCIYSSNEAELYAILLGIQLATQYIKTNANIKRIYLLSDNINAIEGLRQWIYGWRYNESNGFIGTSKIVNSRIYIDILMHINALGYPISFNHIKGHSYQKRYHKSTYISVLNKFNYLNNYDYSKKYLENIYAFSKCNNDVDSLQDYDYKHDVAIEPIQFRPDAKSMYSTLEEYTQIQGGHLNGYDEEFWN